MSDGLTTELRPLHPMAREVCKKLHGWYDSEGSHHDGARCICGYVDKILQLAWGAGRDAGKAEGRREALERAESMVLAALPPRAFRQRRQASAAIRSILWEQPPSVEKESE